MQTVEMAYNAVFQLRSQLVSGQLTNFDSDMATALYLQKYIYALREYSLGNLDSSGTELSKLRPYTFN